MEQEAEKQLESYAQDEQFLAGGLGKTTLKKLVLIFHGWELIGMKEV